MLSQVVGQRKLINQREVSLLRERRIQGRSLHSLRAASGNSKEPEGFPVAWEIANAFSVAQSPIALLAEQGERRLRWWSRDATTIFLWRRDLCPTLRGLFLT